MDKLYQALQKTEDFVKTQANDTSIFSQKLRTILSQKETQIPEMLYIGSLYMGNNNLPAHMPWREVGGYVLHAKRIPDFFMAFLCAQLATRMPQGLCKFTLIDLKMLGTDFQPLKKIGKTYIENLVTEEVHLKNRLDDNINTSTQLIQDYLVDVPDLATYNQHTNSKEPYRVFVIANFPYGFSQETSAKLFKLLNNYQKTGVRFIIHYDNVENQTRMYQNREIQQGLSGLIQIPDNKVYNDWIGVNGTTSVLFKTDLAYENLGKKMLESITFNAEDLYSADDLREGIRLLMGKKGASPHYFEVGYDTTTKETPHHAIIAGQPGKGKSVLLNNLIANGIKAYSPDELRFMLIDCKGVEFQEYKDAQHIQAYCSSSEIEKTLQIVQKIEAELKYREQLFRDAGARNIREYKKMTGKPMPRILCIIDEFQKLFLGTMKQTSYVETVLVNNVVRTGRSYGVNLVLCTQSLGDGVRRSFLENIPLRIALGMTEEQSGSFLGMRNTMAGNLPKAQCIYNDSNGNLKSNQKIIIDHMKTEDVLKIIQDFKQKNIDYQQFEPFIVE